MSKRVNLKAIRMGAVIGDQGRVTIADSIQKYRFTLDETPSDHLLGQDPALGHTPPLPGQADLPFSISAWVYLEDDPMPDPTNPHYSVAVSKYSKTGGSGVKEYLFGIVRSSRNSITRTRLFLSLYDDISGTGTVIRFRQQAGLPVANEFPKNQWKHIVATYGGNPSRPGHGLAGDTDLAVYVDGHLQTTELAGANGYGVYEYTSNTTSYEAMPGFRDDMPGLVIGNSHDASMTFLGKIADVCMFNKKLSSAEVTEVYNSGRVKDMSKFSDQDSLMSWWKMGDDLDNASSAGIKDYVTNSINHGTIQDTAEIITDPSLPSERTTPGGIIVPTSWGRTRQPKNLAGDHQVYIHGGLSGDMPTADPSSSTDGYTVENQRYLHLYWKAASTTTTVTIWGYSHATGQWSEIFDTNGVQIELSTTASEIDTYRIFEIAGVDKVYFKQSGDALASTDLFAAAASTF